MSNITLKPAQGDLIISDYEGDGVFVYEYVYGVGPARAEADAETFDSVEEAEAAIISDAISAQVYVGDMGIWDADGRAYYRHDFVLSEPCWS